MKVSRKHAYGVLVCALLLVGASCGSDSTAEDSSEPVDSSEPIDPDEPESGGTLTYLTQQEVLTLDPGKLASPTAAEGTRGFAVFDSLVLQDPETGEYTFRLAESITSDDNITWELKLRPEVQFSDGTPLNAEALKFNWERIADPATESPKAGVVQQIASMSVVDEETLEVELTAPNGSFPSLVATHLPYVGSPTAIKADPEGFATNPVGAGAYMVEEWVQNDHLRLSRNPNYYGTTYVDEVVIRVIPDMTQLYNTLTTSDDAVAFIPDQRILAQAEDDGLAVNAFAGNGGNDVIFNVNAEPFDDVRAREAVIMAIDPERMSAALYAGEGVPATSPFAESSPYYDDTLTQPAHDPAGAQELFDELAAEGKPLSFTLLTDGSYVTHAEFIQTALSSYDNVTVDIDRQGSILEIVPNVRAGDFDAWLIAMQFIDPVLGLEEAYGTGGGRNWPGYSNAEVDAALDSALAATDTAAREAGIEAALRQVVADVPLGFLLRLTTGHAYDGDVVKSVDVSFLAIFDFTRVWLDRS